MTRRAAAGVAVLISCLLASVEAAAARPRLGQHTMVLGTGLAEHPPASEVLASERDICLLLTHFEPDNPSPFELFSGEEIARAALALDLDAHEERLGLEMEPGDLGLEPLRGPPELDGETHRGEWPSYPKTRIGGIGLFLGTGGGAEEKLSLGLHWVCGVSRCEVVEGKPQDPLGLCMGLDDIPCMEYAREWAMQDPRDQARRAARSLKHQGIGALHAIPNLVKSLPGTIASVAPLLLNPAGVAADGIAAVARGVGTIAGDPSGAAAAAKSAGIRAGNAALNADSDRVSEFAGEQLFLLAAGGVGATTEGANFASKARALASTFEISWDRQVLFSTNGVGPGGFRIPIKVSKKAASGSGLVALEKPGRVMFGGKEVRGVRDLSHVGTSTLEVMAEQGFAARDVNGRKLILHHLGQSPTGPVVEIPAPFHSIWNKNQHPFGNAPGVGLTEGEREAFNLWREDYWRERARAELSKRMAGQ